MGEDKVALTEREAELYDRQIRLWGFEAQARLRRAKVLLIGMDGLGAEIFKNISLSGVNAITIVDQRLVTEEDLRNQFFIDKSHIGKPIGEASMARGQALNPLVKVHNEEKPLSEILTREQIVAYSVVISVNQLLSVNLELDSLCRENSIQFYAASVFGTYGFVFADLKKHIYSGHKIIVSKNGDIRIPIMIDMRFPSLKEALDTDLSHEEFLKTMKKKPISAYTLKVLLKFQELYKRNPTSSQEDFFKLVNIREELLEKVPQFKERVTNELLRCLCTGMPSAICALVGAVAAQDIVKAVSFKDTPLRNFFFFDPVTLSGHIQYLGPPLPEPTQFK